MKRIGCLLSLSLLLLAFPSCLTVEETYEFKRNGSGFMQYVVDLSEMKTILEMAEEEEGIPMQDEVSFEDVARRLETTDGISSVNIIKDEEAYRFGINFKFKSIGALNNALNQIIIDPEQGGGSRHTFFEMKDDVITRTHMMNQAIDTRELLGEDDSSEMAMEMLESMKYELNFEFKRSVKVVYSSAEAVLGGKKNREVAIVANFKQLTEDPEALNASIVFK